MGRDHLTSAAGAAGRAGVGCGAQLAGGVAFLALAALLFDRIRAAVDPMERSHRAYQLWQAEQLAADTYRANVWAGWAWKLAPALAATVLLCGLSTVIVVVAWRQLAAWQTIRLDRLIAMERARRQMFPEGLTTLAFHDSSRDAPQLAPPPWGDEAGDAAAEGEEGEHTAPPFEALLAEFGPGRPRILGRDLATGELVRLPVEELFNVGIGGTSGAGKSWTVTALAAQHILAGGKLLIIDPHGRKPEGLTRRLEPFAPAFFCRPAIDLPDVGAVVRMVRREVERRKGGRSGKPWLVVVDEYAALMRSSVADEVGAMVEELGQEGRGFGMTALVSSQIWNGTRAGGSEVRDALASHIIHRLRPAQARMLTGLPADALPADLWSLPRGVFYLFDAGGELRRVAAPLMSDAAVAKVAQLLAGEAPRLATAGYPQATGETIDLGDLVASGKPDGSLMVASGDQATTASESGGAPAADAARAAALFFGGADLPAIVYELRGIKSSEGRRYQTAVAEVQSLIREGARERR